MKLPSGEYIPDYIKQLECENVPKGYKALMDYMLYLRNHFMSVHPETLSVGSFYQGYMTMSYFPITPKALQSQGLKIGLVFNHEEIRFEIWLVGRNKTVQQRQWDLLKVQQWNSYQLSPTAQRSIVEHVLVSNPDFGSMEALTYQLERSALDFIQTIAGQLSK